MRPLSFILVILALVSCEDRRTFELDDFQEQIVLNAIISTDVSWDVNLSYTKSIFDDSEFNLVEDAEIRVLNLNSNQSFFLDRKVRTGTYSRELHPVEGHEYLIEVKVPGKDELSAITYVPSVLEVDVESKLVQNEFGNDNIEIDIEIQDNPDEENYYVWELLPVDPELFVDEKNDPIASAEPVSDIITNSADNLEPSEGSEDPDQEDTAQKDELSPDDIFNFNRIEEENSTNKRDFNIPSFLNESDVRFGKIANRLILDSSFISDIDSDYTVNDPDSEDLGIPLFELKVMAVSSDLYEYLKSYEDYKQNDIRNTSISDPVIIYSNIENGLGIFGGYNLKSFYIY